MVNVTRLSADQLLIQAFVYPPLQHLLYLLRAVVIKTLQAQLLAGLLASDEFPLYPQTTVRYLLAAVIAHLLPPDAPLPTSTQPYFFQRYFSSFTLRFQKDSTPTRFEKVSYRPADRSATIVDRSSSRSFQASQKQKVSQSRMYFSRCFFIISFFYSSSRSGRCSISLSLRRISVLGLLVKRSMVQLQSTMERSMVDCLSSSVSLRLQSRDLDLKAQLLSAQELTVHPRSSWSPSSEDSPSELSHSKQLLLSSLSSMMRSNSLSKRNICRQRELLASHVLPFLLLPPGLVSCAASDPESRTKSSRLSAICVGRRGAARGVRVNWEGSWSIGGNSGVSW